MPQTGKPNTSKQMRSLQEHNQDIDDLKAQIKMYNQLVVWRNLRFAFLKERIEAILKKLVMYMVYLEMENQ